MNEAAPNTKDWKAVEDRQPPGVRLTVTGMVETSNTSQTPHLMKAIPQGSNPRILLLDLALTSSGPGGAVMGWQEARYQESIEPDQYTSVEIRWATETIATIPEIRVVH